MGITHMKVRHEISDYVRSVLSVLVPNAWLFMMHDIKGSGFKGWDNKQTPTKTKNINTTHCIEGLASGTPSRLAQVRRLTSNRKRTSC